MSEAKDYFNSLSNEEFKSLLEDAGFEVEDGDGRIIFTGDVDLLDRYIEIDQLYSVLLNKMDNVIKEHEDVLNSRLDGNIIHSEREAFDKYLSNIRVKIFGLLRHSELDEIKLVKVFKARYNILDRNIQNLTLDNIGTTANRLEEFHHDLSIDIERNILLN